MRRPRGEARSRRAGASRVLAPTLESTSPSPTRAPRIRQDPDEARPHLPGQTPRNPATQPRPDRIGTPSNSGPMHASGAYRLREGHSRGSRQRARSLSVFARLGMQFLDGDAALAASSRDGIGRPRVDRPGEWWQTVFVDDLAIHSVHLNPYSAARRVAQLQILAERLPTGTTWFWATSISPTTGCRPDCRGPAGPWPAARRRVEGCTEAHGTPAGADFRYLLEQLGANPTGGARCSLPPTVGTTVYAEP